MNPVVHLELHTGDLPQARERGEGSIQPHRRGKFGEVTIQRRDRHAVSIPQVARTDSCFRGRFRTIPAWRRTSIECGREQGFLMPPSLLDWVPEGHLVWTILGSVEEMELGAFYADYRADGHGRPAYDPKMMVALLLYAYAKGNRSSRGIERACSEDVACAGQIRALGLTD